MSRPPLHSDSQISQAKADELDALLAAWNAADAEMHAQEAALNGLLTALQPGPPWQAVDLFGDGETKHRDDCARPSGRGLDGHGKVPGGPPERIRSRMKHTPDPAARRSATATATLQQMVDAQGAVESRRSAYNARNAASSALIPAMQKVAWRRSDGAAMPVDKAVDIWGDGRVVSHGATVVPEGLVRMPVRRAA